MTPEGQVDQRLSRHQRLPAAGVREAFSQKNSVAGRLMVLWLREGDDAGLRLAVVTGKRTFRRAVDRARARRLLREAYRRNRWQFQGDVDVVLLARWRLLGSTRERIEADLIRVAAKAGLINEAETT